MRSAPDMGTAVLTADDEVVAGRKAVVRIVAGQPIVCGGQEPVDEKRRQSAPSSAGPADVTPPPAVPARSQFSMLRPVRTLVTSYRSLPGR